MQPATPPATPLTVEACIRSWNESKVGRYGMAEILTPDAPLKKALFGINSFNWTPELDEHFICQVSLTAKGWKVVALLKDKEDAGSTVVLKGVVESAQGSGKDKAWRIKVDTSDDKEIIASLKLETLKPTGLIDFEPGAKLVFEAFRTSRACTVTKLLSPTVTEAFESGEHIAFVRFDWSIVTGDKRSTLAIFSATANAWLHSSITADMLQRCGIRTLARAPNPWPKNREASDTLIEEWQTTLRDGDTVELEALKIDRLRVTTALYKTKDKTGLKIESLVAPLQLRNPVSPDEIIDWVSTSVLQIEALTASKLAVEPEIQVPASPDDILEITAPPASKEPPSTRYKITFQVNDPRLGRGEVTGNFYESKVAAGGLEKKVPCVVRIAAYTNKNTGNTKWIVSTIHRSQPITRIEHDDYSHDQ
jgi:hypothetical protein